MKGFWILCFLCGVLAFVASVHAAVVVCPADGPCVITVPYEVAVAPPGAAEVVAPAGAAVVVRHGLVPRLWRGWIVERPHRLNVKIQTRRAAVRVHVNR